MVIASLFLWVGFGFGGGGRDGGFGFGGLGTEVHLKRADRDSIIRIASPQVERVCNNQHATLATIAATSCHQ